MILRSRAGSPFAVWNVILMAASLFAPLCWRRPARAGDEVPPEQQVLIISRALVYDDNFKERVGPEVKVGIVSKGGNPASEAAAAAMLKAWKGVGHLKLGGLPVKFSTVVWKDAASFAAAAAAESIDVFYLCPGLEPHLAEIFDVSRKRRTITIGSREDHLKRGASLGVFLASGRPTIMVNLPASRSEGASFSSDLLRLATVLK